MDFVSECADRAAIERVYYEHRIGDKLPFEQTMPADLVGKLVREDLHKETVLKRRFAVELTAAQVDAEVQRINTTTRAPEVLAEIKAGLGHDPARFANAFAKPILVDRLLREKYDNDDSIHAGVRREATKIRSELLIVRKSGANTQKLLEVLNSGHSNAVTEIEWQLAPRPTETNTSGAEETEIKKQIGPNAQLLASVSTVPQVQKHYFEDLPAELRDVLRVQLAHAGDVSAVIEAPGGFLLCVAREKTDTALTVSQLFLAKENYEQWLKEQINTNSLP